jgi:hypothetical protein
MRSRGFVVAMRAQVLLSPFEQPFLRSAPAMADWLIVSRWGGNSEYLSISSALGPAPVDPSEMPDLPAAAHHAAGCAECRAATAADEAAAAAAVGTGGAAADPRAAAAPPGRPGTGPVPHGRRGGGNGAPAPIGLHPRRTWFGVLTAEQAGGRESLFLLTHHLPRSVPVAGRFAPAEGYARLCALDDEGTLRLTAAGRELAEGGDPAGPGGGRGGKGGGARDAAAPEEVRWDVAGILARIGSGGGGAGAAGAGAEAGPVRGVAWTVTAERRPRDGEFLDLKG